MKRYIWDFIHEDEEQTEEREEVCSCASCGKPLFYGDEAVGIVDQTTPVILCEDCADERMTLSEWLDVLQLTYYANEVGKVERYTLADARENAKRLAARL